LGTSSALCDPLCHAREWSLSRSRARALSLALSFSFPLSVCQFVSFSFSFSLSLKRERRWRFWGRTSTNELKGALCDAWGQVLAASLQLVG
jgi:hypothetical protein